MKISPIFLPIFLTLLATPQGQEFLKSLQPFRSPRRNKEGGFWDSIEYFNPEEFDSPDAPGSGMEYMNHDFVERLDAARDAAGFPFRISSGFRTPAKNSNVKGVSNSAHMIGRAADILFDSFEEALEAARSMLGVGFRRIGFYKTKRHVTAYFIHVDNDPDKPKSLWFSNKYVSTSMGERNGYEDVPSYQMEIVKKLYNSF